MGKHYQIPLPQDQGTGLGKPLKLINHPVREEIPIAIASLGQQSVAMTAELADAWLPAFYTADAAAASGATPSPAATPSAIPSVRPLEVFAGGTVAIGEGLEGMRDRARPRAALYIGGMGARSKNFYNDIFAKSGYPEEAKLIQDLYLSGEKKAAEEAIPDEYLAKSSLIGPDGFVKERLAALRESGVSSLNVSFAGRSAQERIAQCDKLRNLVEGM